MTQVAEQKFNFKARTLRDDDGKELGKTKKQSPVIVNLVVPTNQELSDVMASQDPAYDKIKSLINDAVLSVIRDQARSQFDTIIEDFGNDDTKTVTAEMLDHDKLTLSFIASLPPAQRGLRALTEEELTEFYADYLQVMIAATGKEEKRIKAHINLFEKPIRAKQNKDATAIMNVLVDQLDIYLATSQNVESTGEAASRIQNKFKKWLSEENTFDATAL